MSRIILLFVFSLFLSSRLDAQIISQVRLSTDTLQIGEEFTLTFRITENSGAKINAVDYKAFDSIKTEVKISEIPDSLLRETFAELEWPIDMNVPNKQIPISSFVRTGNVLEKSIAVRFWDVGVFVIPQLEIIQDSTSNVEVRHLGTPYVYVLPPEGVAPQDTTQMLMPLKNILKEPKTWEDFVWLAYLLAALFTILVIAYLAYRSKYKTDEEEVIEEVIIRPAHEISIEKLDELQSKKLWQEGKIKSYQSELTYIIREYLENRYGVPALESTTDEIFVSLKKTDFDPSQEKNLREILTIADLVKFAKANPSDDIHSKFMDQAYELVERTKKLISEIENTDAELDH